MSYDDEEEQCIRLLSYCKKHRQPSKEHHLSPSEYTNPNPNSSINPPGATSGAGPSIPPPNPSGCARCGMLIFLYVVCTSYSRMAESALQKKS